MENQQEYIERRIIIASAISTNFLIQIRPHWNPGWMESDAARTVVSWCVEYFDSYGRAPEKNLEAIYRSKLRAGINKDEAELIEIILSELSDQATQQPPDIEYLITETKTYFRERQLRVTIEDAEYELDKGNTEAAKNLIEKFAPTTEEDTSTINPFSADAKETVKRAFEERGKCLIKFPKALGAFWNAELVRGGFVAIMGQEKIGKSFLMIELLMRAIRSGSKVAFFQAGDMTEEQQMRRMAVYLANKSDDPRYCHRKLIPVPDCLFHQLDECDLKVREEGDLIFRAKEDVTYEGLITALRSHPEHVPCRNCKRMRGTPWFKEAPANQPLTWTEGYRLLRQYGRKYGNVCRLSTHANETLSVKGMKFLLEGWAKREDFKPDVIIVDYADLLTPDSDIATQDFRQQQGRIWQRLRNLSQEQNCLVVTATQIKAAGYKKKLLTLGDFSEDKRKHAHVTAMYGLNQTDEEKRIGLMRINELVIRESDFDRQRPVTVLQRLQIGRPVLGSY